MTINQQTLQAIAAATGSNPMQQATVAAAVAAAVAAGSQTMANQILEVTQASGVPLNGGTVGIFYAGYDTINYTNAIECQNLSEGRGYLINNTAAGPAASVSLATDGNGHKLVQSTAVNGATTTITSTGINSDGSIAFNDVQATAISGNITTRTNTFDDNGDGVIDRKQVITTTTNAVNDNDWRMKWVA